MSLPTARWRSLITEACAYAAPVPEDVLEAMVLVESNGNPQARSVSDARGLTQIIPRWHAGVLGQKVAQDLGVALTDDVWFDPRFSLYAGARLLKGNYGACGSWVGAVRKYHSGSCEPAPGFVDGGGTSSDQHITKYLKALQDVRADRATTSPQEVPDMAYTPKQLWWWLHENRTISGVYLPGVIRYIPNRNGSAIRGIVHHIQEGSNFGTWQHFHAVKASSTVLIGKDGTIVWLVPEQHGPWTNGDVANPDAFIRAMMNAYGPDPNAWVLTIEYEGYPGGLPYTEAQFQSGLWLTRHWMQKYGITDINRAVIRHGQINSVSRDKCPEPHPYPFTTRLKKELGGAVVVPTGDYKAGTVVRFTENLNIREAPGLSGKLVTTLKAGTVATILDGKLHPRDGYNYYDVSIEGFGTGFVIDSFERVEAPPPPVVTPQETFTARFDLPFRSAPGFNGPITGTVKAGTTGEVLDGPDEHDGIPWYKVRINGTGEGWLPGSILHTLQINSVAKAVETLTKVLEDAL